MKRTLSLVTASFLAISAFGITANAQTRRTAKPAQTNANASTTRANLTRIETQTGVFRSTLDSSIDANPSLKNSSVEFDSNSYLQDFEAQLNAIQGRSSNPTANDVRVLLSRANDLNKFIRGNALGSRVNRDWSSLRVSLDALAQNYKLSANWDDSAVVVNNNQSQNPSTSTTGNLPNYNYDSRFTGTYSLDATRSDSAQVVAARAVTELPVNQREQARIGILQNIETPDKLSIEQRGQQITFASSRASRYMFDADGVDKTTTNNGTQMRIRATLNNTKLDVATVNNQNEDYNITYEMTDNGRGMKVTRQLTTSYLQQPIVVTSYYGRTDDIAQLDLYERSNNIGTSNGGTTNGSSSGSSSSGIVHNDYIVTNDTALTATLNESLSTKSAKDKDRFTMTVQTPSQYNGAIIEGYVSNVTKAGKLLGRSSMTFNFDRIKLANGETYNFAGFVKTMKTKSGNIVNVDTEGAAQGGSQTTQTAIRTGIGTAGGAAIGGIAGGTKGAVLGAVIGATAGAGSVYLLGGGDLELASGATVTLRASAPSNASATTNR